MKLKEVGSEREKLRDMTVDQLTDELAKLKREAFNLRFQGATGQLENTARLSQVRKSVARVQTFLSQKRRTASAE